MLADRPSVPGWQDRVARGAVSTAAQMTCLNLRVREDDRFELLRWMQRRGLTITEMLRQGISALLDREGVSPEEVPLSWRR